MRQSLINRTILLSLSLMVCCNSAYSLTTTANNVWTVVTGYGHIKPESPYFYQIDSHWRFNTTQHTFRQNLNTIRLGKELNPMFNYVLGYAFSPTRLLSGKIFYENRIWQQVEFKKNITTHFKLQMYNRVEQRFASRRSDISLRNRFRWTLKYCKKDLLLCPLISSETFINLNNARWDPVKTLSQQRSYVGLEFKPSSKNTVRVGYLNQYIRLNRFNAIFNIFDIAFAHNFD